jgi:hypothetical protein
MNFADLSPQVKQANALLSDVNSKVGVYRLKIKELLSSPQVVNARKVMQEQGAEFRKRLAESIAQQQAMLKSLKAPRQGNGQKAPYIFKVDGEQVEIKNTDNNKTLKVPLSEVGYNTAFIGNDKGATGKIAEIDLTFQQGKSLVKAIRG